MDSLKRNKKLQTPTPVGEDTMMIKDPLVIMFLDNKKIVCHIHYSKDITHEHYGMAVCDLVRHVAKAFKVGEDAVWQWVDMERHNPTTTIEQVN